MNTVEFIKGFLTQTLGNKKTHSAYRVMEGEHCRLLVKTDRVHGRPTDVTIIAIDLSTSKTKFMFRGCNNPFRHQTASSIGWHNWQSIPAAMLTKNDNEILSSGVVDESGSHALIEIGNSPFLFTYADNNNLNNGCPKILVAEPVPNRVASVKEAIDLVKIPDGQVTLLNEWEATPMPEGWKPPAFSEENANILHTPLDPIKMGYTLEECLVNDSYIIPAECFGKRPAITTNRQQVWYDALDKRRIASDLFNTMYPNIWKGISVKLNQWSSYSLVEKTGQIVISPSGNYVIGKIQSEYNSRVKEDIYMWHRLEHRLVKHMF